ncbi:hypothetical protein TWF281_000807 [Arthrobotrys megalospora]
MQSSKYPPPPLPKGWTEHRAPTGHNYYYHAESKTSTYTRPIDPAHAPAPAPQAHPSQPFHHNQPDQFTFNYPNPHHNQQFHHQGGQNQPPRRPRHQDKPDKPKTKRPIPNASPWLFVTTKKGNTFIHNPETKESLWDAPESLKSAIESFEKLTLDEERDRERTRRRQSALDRQRREQEEAFANQAEAAEEEEGFDDQEEYYEEDEETTLHGIKRQASAPAEGEEGDYYDDEEEFDEEHDEKRMRMEAGGPVEFTEDDIAWQLGDIAAQYGIGEEDMGETDDLAPEDGALLFKDLLNDLNVSPYSTWDSELPRLVEDGRYTALPTTKMRKQVFGEWCQERIAILKKEKEKEVKKDPRVAYLAFIEANATPKLYWPEFKRKFKKEVPMKDVKVSDKDREKYYRDYISRIKTSVETRENDLKKYLKTVKDLRRGTSIDNLPPSVECDIRYVVVPKDRRDPIVESHIKTLPEDAGEDSSSKDNLEKQRRAIEEREAAVRKEHFYNRKEIARGKEALRETEMEIKRAMNVSKEGLLGHLEPLAKENEGEEDKSS